jgi:hypothetical protein
MAGMDENPYQSPRASRELIAAEASVDDERGSFIRVLVVEILVVPAVVFLLAWMLGCASIR